MDGEQTPRSASRTRLESFRLQHDTRRLSAQPDQESSHQSIPSLPLDTLRASAAQGNDSPSARPLSTRRLKKELLCGDSRNRDISNAAGHVQLVDQCGTPRSVRVVQQEALEDFNMVSVKWLWSVDNKTHQIDLRHGRVSGIRKIYVNREMIFRRPPPRGAQGPHMRTSHCPGKRPGGGGGGGVGTTLSVVAQQATV